MSSARSPETSRTSRLHPRYIASGERVAVVVRYTGTGKDTGKQLDLPVVHVWDVRNGKIAQFRQFIDTAKFLEVVPA